MSIEEKAEDVTAPSFLRKAVWRLTAPSRPPIKKWPDYPEPPLGTLEVWGDSPIN